MVVLLSIRQALGWVDNTEHLFSIKYIMLPIVCQEKNDLTSLKSSLFLYFNALFDCTVKR